VALNWRQGYRTTFRRQGIEIVAQVGRDVKRLSLALTGYGFEGALRRLDEVEPAMANERVEYRRGPVTEWYANKPTGLEQGFDLAEPPEGGPGSLVLSKWR
jgi:hypothetical protein